ncbi:MAG: hypothetical protein SVT52_08770 [Planctomycetota bacterium]|nr:hypothetical protein [Planctomycetota bacterium]
MSTRARLQACGCSRRRPGAAEISKASGPDNHVTMSNRMSQFDGRLAVCPPLDDEQLTAIPARRGVFLLADESGKPVLLATAASIRARLRARLTAPADQKRKRAADLRQVTRQIFWKLAGGHFETDLMFFELARRIWPKEYVKMPAWKPAWFVGVNVADNVPHFVRTREVFAVGGRYFGPFARARSAEEFVKAIQDAFDLCRDVRRLRLSSGVQSCTYAQIGRCLRPCDGSISMDAYRAVLSRAADFAAGDREPLRRQLTRQMKQASGKLNFEAAADCKARLDRLAAFDARALSYGRPVEQFRYLLVQPSGSSRKAKLFLVDRGFIAAGKPLDFPLLDAQLRSVLDKMNRFVARRRTPGEPERWRLGLVARYLFSGDERKGLMFHWHGDVTVRQLRLAVEAAADRLRLRAPRKRGSVSEAR